MAFESIPDRRTKAITYHKIFSAGLYILGGLIVVAMLWSFLSDRSDDWLLQGRYVELTPDRYAAGSVTHFAFDEWRPPRPMGFFLLADADGTYMAVADRPFGCVLAWKASTQELTDPCRGLAFSRQRLLADPPAEMQLLPVTLNGDKIRVDLQEILD